MKRIITTTLVLFFWAGALAQSAEQHPKVETLKIELDEDISAFNTLTRKQTKKDTLPKVARLYRFKNARIIKELAFKTKKTSLTV